MRSPLLSEKGPQQADRLEGTVVTSNAGQPTVAYTKPSNTTFVAHADVKQDAGGLKVVVMAVYLKSSSDREHCIKKLTGN
jgi:hypothetical protein